MSFGSSSAWLCQPCVPVREEDGAGVPWERVGGTFLARPPGEVSPGQHCQAGTLTGRALAEDLC